MMWPSIAGIGGLLAGLLTGAAFASSETLWLSGQYEILDGAHEELQDSHRMLVGRNAELDADLQSARSDLEELQAQRDGLEQRASELEKQASELEEREAAVQKEEKKAAENSFDDGTYLVGVDIKPGRYQAKDAGSRCYWERLKGTSGDGDEIIANGFGDTAPIVTIERSDNAFQTSNCGTWTKK